MSYILEALRKAERERNLGQVPTIERSADETGAPPRRGWIVLVLVVALIINAGVLAAWLLRNPATVPPAEVARELSPPPAPTPSVPEYLPPPTTVVEAPIEEAPIAPAPVEVEQEPTDFSVADEPAPEIAEADVSDLPATEEDDEGLPPLLRDMPPEFRRNLPEMKIDAHFHTDVPGRSFAMINLRKYKPGERLSEGPQVVEILAEGVVLEYQGRKFLLAP